MNLHCYPKTQGDMFLHYDEHMGTVVSLNSVWPAAKNTHEYIQKYKTAHAHAVLAQVHIMLYSVLLKLFYNKFK